MARVRLAGRPFLLVGNVVKQVVTPFNIGIGSGDLKRSDISLTRHVSWENFGGGVGLYRLREGKETDQFADATDVWSVGRKHLVLANKRTNAGIAGTTELGVATVFLPTGATSEEIVVTERSTGKIYYWSSPTFWTEAHDAAGFIRDLKVYRQGGTDYLFAAWGSNYSYSSDGVTWASPSPAVTADFFTVFDNKLVKIRAGNLAYSTDPASATPTWTDHVQDIPGYVTSLYGNWRNAQGDPTLAVGTMTGIWNIDFWTQTKYLLLDLRLAAPSGWETIQSTVIPTANIAGGMVVWNGSLMVPHGLGLIALRPDGAWAEIGLSRQDGLQNTAHGTGFIASIATLVPLRNYLLAQLRSTASATTGSAWAWTGSAWHPLITGVARSQGTLMFSAQLPLAAAGPNLWVGNGAGGQVQYCYFDDVEDPTNLGGLGLTSRARQASGTWTSAWTDLGFSEFEKVGYQVDIVASGLTNTETVTVEYQINDDETAWTQLGITSQSQRSYKMKFRGGEGLPFYSIRLRLTLARGSTTTRTPKVDSLVLRYIDTPNIRYAHNLTLSIENEDDAEFLRALSTQKGSFVFWPDDEDPDEQLLVRVTNGPVDPASNVFPRNVQVTVASPL